MRILLVAEFEYETPSAMQAVRRRSVRVESLMDEGEAAWGVGHEDQVGAF